MDHDRENFLPLLRLSSGSNFLGEKVYRAEHRAKTQLEHGAAGFERKKTLRQCENVTTDTCYFRPDP
jgi:hypothetical protein